MKSLNPELLINGQPYSKVLRKNERKRKEVRKGREARKDKYALNEPITYTAKDIVEKNGKKYLKIKLNKRSVLLPVLNIGSENKPEYIAILDPNDKTVLRHSTKELAHILDKLNISLVITPPSSKSERLVEKSRRLAKIKNPPLVLFGGSTQKDGQKYLYTQQDVIDLVDDGTRYWTISCKPITLKKDGPSKYFGINETQLKKIVASINNGEKIAIVDDVFSSGATIRAIIELLTRALNQLNIKVPELPIVVIAEERLEQKLDKKANELEIYSKVVIPVLNNI